MPRDAKGGSDGDGIVGNAGSVSEGGLGNPNPDRSSERLRLGSDGSDGNGIVGNAGRLSDGIAGNPNSDKSRDKLREGREGRDGNGIEGRAGRERREKLQRLK